MTTPRLLLPLAASLALGLALRAPSETVPPALAALRGFIAEQQEAGEIDKQEAGWRTGLPKFPRVEFSGQVAYLWVLETSEGTLTAELFHEAAPEHVRNILYLTELDFYDGLGFHRIIPGFMAQGGCPLGRGTGGPGYNIKLEAGADVPHKGAGILSMARSGHPDSAGSQFFITFASQPRLDEQYTVFGKVVEGMDALEKLEGAGNPNPRSNGVPPLKKIVIENAEIRWREVPAGTP